VQITGLVYCDAIMQHQGCIHGSLYCKKFVLKTVSSIYENHLLDAEVNSTDVSSFFSNPVIIGHNAKRTVIDYLN